MATRVSECNMCRCMRHVCDALAVCRMTCSAHVACWPHVGCWTRCLLLLLVVYCLLLVACCLLLVACCLLLVACCLLLVACCLFDTCLSHLAPKNRRRTAPPRGGYSPGNTVQDFCLRRICECFEVGPLPPGS